MVDIRAKSVGNYFLRLIGGILVILGILGAFTALTQPNPVGLVLSVLFLAVSGIMVKKAY